MRTVMAACVVAATLVIAPALAADVFPWAGYGWHPTVSWRDYYAYNYHYPVVAPDGRFWSRSYRRHWSWRR